MSGVELKPCPFCGSTHVEFVTDKGPTGECYGYVTCGGCDAMSVCVDVRSMQHEELHPVDAWNTRANPQAALIAELCEAVETAIDEIVYLMNARWSEVEATEDQMVGDYRAALAKARGQV